MDQAAVFMPVVWYLQTKVVATKYVIYGNSFIENKQSEPMVYVCHWTELEHSNNGRSQSFPSNYAWTPLKSLFLVQ